MSHNRRHIIIDSMRTAFTNPDVRDEMTQRQRNRVDQILEAEEPNDEQFRYLSRRLTQVYCEED